MGGEDNSHTFETEDRTMPPEQVNRLAEQSPAVKDFLIQQHIANSVSRACDNCPEVPSLRIVADYEARKASSAGDRMASKLTRNQDLIIATDEESLRLFFRECDPFKDEQYQQQFDELKRGFEKITNIYETESSEVQSSRAKNLIEKLSPEIKAVFKLALSAASNLDDAKKEYLKVKQQVGIKKELFRYFEDPGVRILAATQEFARVQTQSWEAAKAARELLDLIYNNIQDSETIWPAIAHLTKETNLSPVD